MPRRQHDVKQSDLRRVVFGPLSVAIELADNYCGEKENDRSRDPECGGKILWCQHRNRAMRWSKVGIHVPEMLTGIQQDKGQ